MKYVRYQKVYGESCFKALVVLVKNGIESLKIIKCLLPDLEKEIDIEWRPDEKRHLEYVAKRMREEINGKIEYLNTPIKTLLNIDERFLDIDEYEVYEWAYGISKQVNDEIRKKMLEEYQENE